MYYGSGTVAHTASQWRHIMRQASSRVAGSICSSLCSTECSLASFYTEHIFTFSVWPNIMATILKIWHIIKKWTRQLMCIYVKDIPAKFHPNPIWNDRVLHFFEEVPKQARTTRRMDHYLSTIVFSIISATLLRQKNNIWFNIWAEWNTNSVETLSMDNWGTY